MNPIFTCVWLSCMLVSATGFAQIEPTFPDLDYAGDNHLRQAMDLYVPSGLKGPAPVVMYIHGGAWRGGDKGEAMRYADSLLAAGYLVADITYRLSKDSPWPAQIEDCKAAVRFLKLNAERFGIDSSRIGVMGHSAGGHLAAMLACGSNAQKLEGPYLRDMGISSSVQAAIDFFGPTNFARMSDFPPDPTWNCPSPLDHDSPDSPESELLGCPVPDCPDRVALADPATYVNGDEPPIWIVHGDRDCLVPADQSRYLYERLKQVESPVELSILEGEGHGGKAFSTPDMRGKIRRFFDAHLQGE